MLIFFIQKFNDIDHFTPIVYKIAKDTDEKIMVLSLNPFYDIYNDFRLQFLKDKYNITVDYIYNIHRPAYFYRKLRCFLASSYTGKTFSSNIKIIFEQIKSGLKDRKSFYRALSMLVLALIRSLIARFNIHKRLFMQHYDEKWVEEMMNSYKPSVLIFDHAATNRTPTVGSLLRVSKKMRIPTISLPHGIPLLLDHPKGYDKGKQDFVANKCDFIVFQHRWWKDECVRYGVDPKKALTLGLVRYCKEWVDILRKIIPPDRSLQNKGKGKLKIVYMDSGPDRFPQYKSLAHDAVRRICELDFVHLIFKPHTRRNIAHLQVPRSVEVAQNTNSVDLIKWADVVIGMHSSIMIEALIQNKVYLSPTYFRDRKTIYEEYGACWMVDSIAELIKALKILKNNPFYKPYSKESGERFLTDVVYNHEKDRDVLGVYKDFILGIARGKRQSDA